MLFLIYLTIGILFSAWGMITIYVPIIEELKYLIGEKYALKDHKRLGNTNAFIAFLLAIVFWPVLLYYIITYGKYNFMKSYKHQLWLDLRHEIENASSKK
jgi:hypothetical protein